MKKIIPQIFLLLIGFFGCWTALSQIPWMKIIKVQEHQSEIETTLGKMVWEDIASEYFEVTEKTIVTPIDSILNVLCEKNDIERTNIRLHVIKNTDVNAFAIPDGQLVINTGLIKACKNADELAGVMAHELAHITERHVMQKLAQEIGLVTLTSITTGSSDIGGVVQILTSSAFSREVEREADLKAINYLAAARIPVTGMADFLYRIGTEHGELEEYMTWISSHPDSEERASYIIEEGKRRQGKNFKAVPPISSQTMEKLKYDIDDSSN